MLNNCIDLVSQVMDLPSDFGITFNYSEFVYCSPAENVEMDVFSRLEDLKIWHLDSKDTIEFSVVRGRIELIE